MGVNIFMVVLGYYGFLMKILLLYVACMMLFYLLATHFGVILGVVKGRVKI